MTKVKFGSQIDTRKYENTGNKIAFAWQPHNVTHLLILIVPSQVAHKAPTRSLQISLSWANLAAALPKPIVTPFISSSTVLLHVVRGRPLHLLPSGVQVSAILAFAVGSILSTWPSLFPRNVATRYYQGP